jgi:hypothetical protein
MHGPKKLRSSRQHPLVKRAKALSIIEEDWGRDWGKSEVLNGVFRT